MVIPTLNAFIKTKLTKSWHYHKNFKLKNRLLNFLYSKKVFRNISSILTWDKHLRLCQVNCVRLLLQWHKFQIRLATIQVFLTSCHEECNNGISRKNVICISEFKYFGICFVLDSNHACYFVLYIFEFLLGKYCWSDNLCCSPRIGLKFQFIECFGVRYVKPWPSSPSSASPSA